VTQRTEAANGTGGLQEEAYAQLSQSTPNDGNKQRHDF